MTKILEINNLNKKYDKFQLKDVSFNLEEGAIMGLVGRNGAGKTTIIKSIMDLIKIDSGEIKVFGGALNKEAKENIGIVFDDGFFSEQYNAKQIGNILKNIYKNWDSGKYLGYLNKMGLPDDKLIKDFSRGMQMKLSFAIAVSHNPRLLILDEPTSGLDPVFRNEILEMFLDFIQDERNSILISSHITTDLEKIADYITFIDDGEIIFSKEKDDFIYSYGICKCTLKDLYEIDRKYVVKYLKNSNYIDVIIENIEEFRKEYPNLVTEKMNIDDYMVIFTNGENI
ncbi:MAG: ABC transporter ATP-binding protein [Miniphocaeibacter sp.]|uniref:ABC transporter ATP-binding protein n=1 Tax=Miniphocaeibacter sp. TaxID=3100973 RepID=UPI0017E3ACF8|nr:ABC transporter ATP-binding protein [Gallicola sp.]